LLGVSDATLGVGLAIGWLAVLGISLYQYRQGTRSSERLCLTVSVGVFWLSFGLLQVSTVLAGFAEVGAVALAVVLFCAGIATGARWWQMRTAETDHSAQT
jgi:hypothetical protein